MITPADTTSATPALLQAPAVRFPGKPITIGGKTFVPAPLPLGALRRAAKDGTLATLNGLNPGEIPSSAALDGIHSLILASWKRNYPDMTADDVDDLVDLRNMPEVIAAMMAATGFDAAPAASQDGASGEVSSPSTE